MDPIPIAGPSAGQSAHPSAEVLVTAVCEACEKVKSQCPSASKYVLCGLHNYQKNFASWSQQLRNIHQKDGQPSLNPICACIEGGKVAFVCHLCRDSLPHGVGCKKWGKCIRPPDRAVQIANLKRHCNGKPHRNAARRSGIDVVMKPGSDEAIQSRGSTAPPTAIFLWALQSAFTSSSQMDFTKFVKTNQCVNDSLSTTATDDLRLTDLSKWASRSTMRKCQFSMMAVIEDDDHDVLDRVVRSAFAVDDSDGTRCLRLRCVQANPIIQRRDISGNVVRQHNSTPRDCADATWDCFKQACTPKSARRSLTEAASNLESVEDKVDIRKLGMLVSSMACGSTDGCPAEVKSIPLLRELQRAPYLRYFFRDKSHTVNTVSDTVIKQLKVQDVELLETILALVKRIQFSQRIKHLWQEQLKKPGVGLWVSWEQIYEVAAALAYAEVRFNSRSLPLSRILKWWPCVLRLCALLADDKLPEHKEDHELGLKILHITSGDRGWVRMVCFAVECDFFIIMYRCCALGDKSESSEAKDISLSQAEVIETVDICTAMLGEGRIFDSTPNASYTYELISGMQREPVHWFAAGAIHKHAWPVSEKLLSRPVKFAKSLCDLAVRFLNLNFPDYHWRSTWAAMNSHPESRLPMAVRLDNIEKIARKESLCPTAARYQMGELFQVADSLIKELRSNLRVWTVILERCRCGIGSSQFREDKKEAVSIGLTWMCLWDSTVDVERLLKQVALIEDKSRIRHHGLQILRAHLKIVCHRPNDVRLYVVPKFLPNPESALMRVELEPTSFVERSQEKYFDLFGESKATSGLDAPPLGPVKAARAAQRSCTTAPKRIFNQSKSNVAKLISESERKRRWTESAKAMVCDMKQQQELQSRGVIGEVARASILGPRVMLTSYARAEGLQRTTLQVRNDRKARKHAAEAHTTFLLEEQTGLSLPVKPFRVVQPQSDDAASRPAVVPRRVASLNAAQKAALRSKIALLNRDGRRGPSHVSGCGHASVPPSLGLGHGCGAAAAASPPSAQPARGSPSIGVAVGHNLALFYQSGG